MAPNSTSLRRKSLLEDESPILVACRRRGRVALVVLNGHDFVEVRRLDLPESAPVARRRTFRRTLKQLATDYGVRDIVVGTLVHEAAHALNFERGIRDCSRSQYHNQKFKAAAEELGLDVTQVPHYGFALTMMRAETAMRYAIETVGLSIVLMHRRSEVMPTADTKGTGDRKSDDDQDHDNGKDKDKDKDKGGRYKKAACACPFNIRVSRKVMTTTVIRCETCGDSFQLA